MEELALFCGTISGHKKDKFSEGKFKFEDCKNISCYRIRGCVAYMECRVVNIVETGDHFMILGEVISQEEGVDRKKLFQSNISGPYTFTTTK
jgi:flavin reductase (DIM6/NTAB) family NADH-FMN oxidoreductase RutF